MTEPTMIERIARILCEQDLSDPDSLVMGEGAIAGTSYPGWLAYASNARDIIAAMQQPTGAMRDAGKSMGFGKDPTDYWARMINAAASEAELPFKL